MIGQTIVHYTVVEKLGEGGMGVVYKARDKRLDRTVALKFVAAHLRDDVEVKQRLLREAHAAASLNHPNICTIHEIDEANGFIAMEFIEGTTVKEKIGARPLLVQEALDIAIQACTGLQAAHEKGIVHRDIKPANLMVGAQGHVKVMDFGLAQMDDRTSITRTGSSVGTPSYMSPEQTQGQPTDRRTDIWSIGVTLFEMLTGRRPFSGETDQAVSYAIVHTQPEPVTAMRSGLPLELDRILAKALAKIPEERYQNVADLVVDLRGASAVRQSSSGRTLRTRRPVYLLAAALILAGVGVAAWRAVAPERPHGALVILPLRPLTQEATDSLLGLGIADALITKIGQTGRLQVRPISAVRKYSKEDTDPVEAARNLGAETVLTGSLQQAGGRIRISVQLLRTANGETVWTKSFDTLAGDIFAVQDEMARQVARELSLKLDTGQQREFEKRLTDNPRAFELYSKSLYHLGNRMRGGEVSLAAGLLEKAVELDSTYALARAQLGYVYALQGVFLMDDPEIIARATKQLDDAEKLDPRIAQIHVARSVLLFSRHGEWNLREAILEARTALRLDPNAGHPDLGYYFDHIGLEELARKHREAALRADPDNAYYKDGLVSHYYGFMRPEEAAAAEQRLFRRPPRVDYYLLKGMVSEAAPMIAKENFIDPSVSSTCSGRFEGPVRLAQLYAFQKNFQAAAKVIGPVELDAENALQCLPYHHVTYGIAQVRALMGNAPRALHWLQVTVDSGFPNYLMMERDRMLDPVRNDPAVAKFLAGLKKTWENNQREFGTE